VYADYTTYTWHCVTVKPHSGTADTSVIGQFMQQTANLSKLSLTAMPLSHLHTNICWLNGCYFILNSESNMTTDRFTMQLTFQLSITPVHQLHLTCHRRGQISWVCDWWRGIGQDTLVRQYTNTHTAVPEIKVSTMICTTLYNNGMFDTCSILRRHLKTHFFCEFLTRRTSASKIFYENALYKFTLQLLTYMC